LPNDSVTLLTGNHLLLHDNYMMPCGIKLLADGKEMLSSGNAMLTLSKTNLLYDLYMLPIGINEMSHGM